MSGRARLPYIDKDYEAILADLVARIPALAPRWTDHNASDLGMALLELVAGVGDMLAYSLDTSAAEAFLPTARLRESIIRTVALVGYSLHGPVSATTTLRFTLDQAQAEAVTIPAGTVCRAPQSDVPFVTVAELVIPAGILIGDIGGRQGIRQSETFTIDDEPALLRLQLAHPTVAHGSVQVSVNGTPWSEVEHFADSAATDQHFCVRLNGLDYLAVVFGTGEQGACPALGDTVVVSYLTTLAEAGNLAHHQITELVDTIRLHGTPVGLAVDNPIAATNGAPAMSHELARVLAPAVVRSTWKAVTKADYVALCRSYPGVGKVAVLDLNDDESLPIYAVRVVLVPAGGGLPSPTLKTELLAYLNARRVITVRVSVDDPVYQAVPVSARLYVLPGYDHADVRARATAALADYFALENREFGQAVYTSDLIALLDGVDGVSHLSLYAPATNLPIAARAIATLGTVSLTTQAVS